MLDLLRKSILHRASLVKVATSSAAIAMLIGLWTSPGLAFGGCVQASPENSSLVLGLLGAGIAALPLLRTRFRKGSRK